MSAYKAALLAAIIAESERRQQEVSSVKPYDPELDLYDLQRVRVNNRDRWQAWPAGRRSGKTVAAEHLLLKVATSATRVQSYYVSTSIKRAVQTIWDELVEINRSRKLGGVPNYSLHTITFPNGSKANVTGVESKAMANDLRGRPRTALWFIDEAQDWPDELLRYFYQDVVFPQLADVSGSVVIAGTGGNPRGFWYEVATGLQTDERTASAGSDFTRFPAWNALQNPKLPVGEARYLIDKSCKTRGVDESAPSIRREWFAEFCTESAHQIFPYSANDNGWDRGVWDFDRKRWTGLPEGKWSYVIGADFGTVDKAAYAVWAYSESDPHLYLVDADAQACMGSSGQTAFVKAAMERYAHGLVGLFGDPGGGGAGIILDLRQIHSLFATAAEKTDKPAACVTLRDGLRSHRVKIATQLVELIHELGIPEWDPQAIGAVVRGHFPDVVDASLYAHRQVAKLHRFVPPKPAMNEQEKLIELARLKQERDRTRLKKMGA